MTNHPTNQDSAAMTAAFQLLESGSHEQAAKAFSSLIAQDDLQNPADVQSMCQALYGRGCALYQQKEHDAAMDDLDEAVRLGMSTANLFRVRAEINYFASFSHEERLDDAQRLLELSPGDSDGYFYRGDALSDLGDYEAAIEDFNRMEAAGQATARMHFQRGNAYNSIGEEEKAAADYDASALLPDTDPNLYHRRAHIYSGRNEYEKALSDFNSAIKLEPESVRHYSCRAAVLYELELEDEIEANYREIDRIQGKDKTMPENRYLIFDTVQEHFNRAKLDELEVIVREFPLRSMPDIQVAFNNLQDNDFNVLQFWATQHGGDAVNQFSSIYIKDRRNPVIPANPKYEEFDIGEEENFRTLKDGVWLLQYNGVNLLALIDASRQRCYTIRIEVAAPSTAEGKAATTAFFAMVEAAIKESRCYRGKILSLEPQDNYSGTTGGIKVHRLKQVSREQVILPSGAVDLLDRNVVNFVKRRARLAELGMATKKGLLFYGPPGTGKTHTVQYLATQLEGHTTLLITGEQVGSLGDYMELARLYEPSVVVIEDVDLIARHRESMRSSSEELMLNKLLNEMDGARSDAKLIFILTTNRAKVLEEALAARPGRIDQAIEFPLPDEEGRKLLVRLYSHGVEVSDEVASYVVTKTPAVSASFIKELMRRSIQFAFDRDEEASSIELADVDAALDELLVAGGSLNRTLLGARDSSKSLGF